MDCKVTLLLESVPTQRAGKWPFTRMATDVPLQSGVILEDFFAVRTRVPNTIL